MSDSLLKAILEVVFGLIVAGIGYGVLWCFSRGRDKPFQPTAEDTTFVGVIVAIVILVIVLMAIT